MAFDHGLERLNGIYDFADSGIGPLHQEFVYSSLIWPDLTSRIMAAYESRTGLALDRERIAVLTGAHRLAELAEFAEDPAHTAAMVANAAKWLAGR